DLRALRVVQAHDGHAGDALTGPRLAHDAEGLSELEAVRQSGDRVHHPVGGREPDREVLHGQKGLLVGGRLLVHSHPSRTRGSRKLYTMSMMMLSVISRNAA